jgi:hypothetical protein
VGECVPDPNYNPHNSGPYQPAEEDVYSETANQPEFDCNKFYLDSDGDGFGDKNTWICEEVAGFVKNKDDCDDTNASIGKPITCNYDGNKCGTVTVCAAECPVPPAEDPCDNKDNNCDGQVDENKNKQYIKTCIGNKVHWQNECGGLEAIVENCKSDEKCIEDTCVYDPPCMPDCVNKDCGDDGCGGICGECSGYDYCNEESKCTTIFDNLCNYGNGTVYGECSKDQICTSWCYGEIWPDYACCPNDKPLLTPYNTPDHPSVMHACCKTCYEKYSFIKLPNDCVQGNLPTYYYL